LPKERILITVKTYPTPSKKYVETVCTAGITEEGEWRRLYPIRFRYLEHEKQYKVFDRIEVDVEPVSKDGRPESRTPRADTLRKIDHIKSWKQRDAWVRPTIFTSMAEMISSDRTIAPVAVREVFDLKILPSEPEWSAAQKTQMNQQGLWLTEEPRSLEKIPYEFRLLWADDAGVEHDNMLISWEVCQTWRRFRTRYQEQALDMLRHKWLDDLLGPGRDIAFFMGNSAQFRDNFMVCGTYTPPREVTHEQRLF